jgi:lipoate-protein ligase A
MIHLLDLGSTPIFEQLRIEEALLRSTDLNICVINQGSPRAIVMGISGMPEKLIEMDLVKEAQIPVIQRFSGGGTVIVDEDTLFMTFILNKDKLPISPFPEPILRWSAYFYTKAWNIPQFHLIENDYAIGRKKCGGNAQYIQKERWLHHTSFLWDYKPENMTFLQLPEKRPKYRENRVHSDFLCKLKDFETSREDLIDQFKAELERQFSVQPIQLDQLTFQPHRQALQLLTLT